MRLARPVLISAALLTSALPALAAPGDDIGAAVRVVNLVTAAFQTDQRNLAKGDAVRQDELIEVSADGIGEIRLRDNTELALGPGARLKLDQFVYNPDISGGAIVVNLVHGAFRFITGIAAKPAYVIRTPTASVTVRGTIFDVYVQPSGMSWLLLIEGAVEVCNAQNSCGLLDEPGRLIRITPDGLIGAPLTWAALKADAPPFNTAFPFVVSPPEVDPDPIFTPGDIVDGGNLPSAPDDDENGGGGPADHGPEDRGPEDHGDAGPLPSGPLVCWSGWKEVPKTWSETGWRVKQKWSGRNVIFCAHPTAPPSGGNGNGLPPQPHCSGGKLVVIRTLPPRWNCACPPGTTRRQTGRNAFECKGAPGGKGGGEPSNAKAECVKSGGIWTGKHCIRREPPSCQQGFVGKWPNCKKRFIAKCPSGMYGKWPICKKRAPNLRTLKPKDAR
jgi:hypothetical protein